MEDHLAAWLKPLEGALMENELAQWLGLRRLYESGNDEAAVMIGGMVSTLTLIVCWGGRKVLDQCLLGWRRRRMSRTVPGVR